MKGLLALACLLVLLSGCQAESVGPAACRHAATRALNDGAWDRAIELLNHDRDCAVAFSPEERRLNLAAAYVGKGGYQLGDIIEILLLSESGDGEEAGRKLLAAFAGMSPDWDSLTYLQGAADEYRRMVAAFPGGLRDACRRDNRGLLSDEQRDACLYNGLLAVVKATATLSLFLAEDLRAWLTHDGLSCANDGNGNRVPDRAETLACLLGVSEDAAGTCADDSVEWRRAGAATAFYDNAAVVAEAELVELRFRAAPGCGPATARYGLLAPDGATALSSGLCRAAAIRERCELADPAADCLPCPVLAPGGGGALTVTTTLIDALNEDVKTFYAVLPEDMQTRLRRKLDRLRREICEGHSACALDPAGELEIHEAAVADYLTRARG